MIHFNFRVLVPGDAEYKGSPSVGPILQIFDARWSGHKFGPLGQPITSYPLASLVAREKFTPLHMVLDVPEWTLDAAQLRNMVATASEVVARRGVTIPRDPLAVA